MVGIIVVEHTMSLQLLWARDAYVEYGAEEEDIVVGSTFRENVRREVNVSVRLG